MTQEAAMGDQEMAAARKSVDVRDVQALLENRHDGQGRIIALLTDIQGRYGYLPEEALRVVADKTGRPFVEVFGVATFYRSFSLEPRGKHLVCACLGTACHIRGAPRVVEELQRQLGIMAAETTPDKEFTLETVNCLGACALGPVVVVDGHYVSNVKKSMVRSLLDKALKGFDRGEVGKDRLIFPIEVSCPCCNHSLMDDTFGVDEHPSIRVTVHFDGKQSWVRLSSLYGSFTVSSELDIPVGTVTDFYCPHCHGRIAGASDCPMCDAPMVPMLVTGGGTVQICSRRGCRSHMLDLA